MKRTLSSKSKKKVIRKQGFRARMATKNGRKTINNRRKKGRKRLAVTCERKH